MSFQNGLVIGKFSPPHAGHRWLINYALDHCKHVDVIVVHYADRPEYIADPHIRRGWLAHIFRREFDAGKIDLWIFTPPPDFPDIDDMRWAKQSEHVIGRHVDALFSFEYERDKGYAQSLQAAFVVPPGTPPVRATLIRANPELYMEQLDPVVQAYYKERGDAATQA